MVKLDWKVSLGLVSLLALGCPAEDGDDVATTTSAATTSATTTPTSAGPDAGSTAESTSSSPADDDAFCATFVDIDSCQAAEIAGPATCVWDTIYTVSLDGDQCSLDDTQQRGLAAAFTSTEPGCAGVSESATEPWFRTDGAQIETIATCGGTPPNGFEPCTFVSEGVFEPPECVCLCEVLAAGG